MRRWGLLGAGLLVGWGVLWLARPGAQLASPSPSPSAAIQSYARAPLDLGGIYWCTRDFPYAAYASGQHFYPPNHPSFPDLRVRPEACFATSADASLAGYTEAAPPLQDREVAEIFLEPAPRGLVRQCREAATQVGFAVPCPTLLPANQPNIPRSITVAGNDGLFVLDHYQFAVPPGDPQAQNPAHGGHLMFLAYRTRDEARLRTLYGADFCPPRGKGPTESLGSSFVQEVPAFIEACVRTGRASDYSFMSGHVNLRWIVRGVTYVISVHGETTDHEELLKYLGPFIRYVAPA